MELDLPALVVIVNNLADWERIQTEGWYRLPLRQAPPAAAASFLAFYPTRAFGPAAWTIRWYAPVIRYQMVRRRDLLPTELDHPRADQFYYRIDVGPLQALPQPIPSWALRRITFIPTTLRRLLTACEINDLWLHDAASDLVRQWFPHAARKAQQRLTVQTQEDALS